MFHIILINYTRVTSAFLNESMPAPSSPFPSLRAAPMQSLCSHLPRHLMEIHSLKEVSMSSPVISAGGQPLKKIRGHKRLYLKNMAWTFFKTSTGFPLQTSQLFPSAVALNLGHIPCPVFRVPVVLHLCPPLQKRCEPWKYIGYVSFTILSVCLISRTTSILLHFFSYGHKDNGIYFFTKYLNCVFMLPWLWAWQELIFTKPTK